MSGGVGSPETGQASSAATGGAAGAQWPPRAMLLTAGFGTRLRPLTDVRAKPAVPVAGVPLVTRILRALRAQGVTDAVLNLHYRPETLAAVVGDGGDADMKVRYSWEPTILGRAGGPRLALPLIASDPFLLVNGDTLSNVDYQAMWREHQDSGALVTLALIPNPDPAWYNGVIVDDAGWVRGFAKAGEVPRSYHLVGAQVVAHSVFLRAPAGQDVDSVWGVYPQLMAEQPQSVRAFICDAGFLDVGTTKDYVAATRQVAAAEGSDPWTPGRRFAAAPDARVERTIVWDDVTVGAGAELLDCILADGVTIPPGARYDHCAIIRAPHVPDVAGHGGRAPRDGERLGDLLVAPISR